MKLNSLAALAGLSRFGHVIAQSGPNYPALSIDMPVILISRIDMEDLADQIFPD